MFCSAMFVPPELSSRLQPNTPLSTHLTLETDSILRLTFTTPTPPPKYAHLEFKEKDTTTGPTGPTGTTKDGKKEEGGKEKKGGKSWIYEVPVKADGRGRFDLVSPSRSVV